MSRAWSDRKSGSGIVGDIFKNSLGEKCPRLIGDKVGIGKAFRF